MGIVIRNCLPLGGWRNGGSTRYGRVHGNMQRIFAYWNMQRVHGNIQRTKEYMETLWSYGMYISVCIQLSKLIKLNT